MFLFREQVFGAFVVDSSVLALGVSILTAQRRASCSSRSLMWLASRRAIDRGLAEGGPERAEQALEQAEV